MKLLLHFRKKIPLQLYWQVLSCSGIFVCSRFTKKNHLDHFCFTFPSYRAAFLWKSFVLKKHSTWLKHDMIVSNQHIFFLGFVNLIFRVMFLLHAIIYSTYYLALLRPISKTSASSFWTTSYGLWDHSFSTYANFSEKLTFFIPWYAHIRVRIRM